MRSWRLSTSPHSFSLTIGSNRLPNAVQLGNSACVNQFDVLPSNCYCLYLILHISNMITAPQLRAARALLGMDQRALAEASGLSLPTIQRMEASDGVIRGNVESLMKLIAALDAAGVELINERAISDNGGRGVRLKAR